MKLKNFTIIIFVCAPIFVCGQEVNKNNSITGTVLNSEQKPIEGAAIFIDNKITRSLTDNKGFYEIKIKSGAKQIKVSSTIYGDSASEIAGRTKINFQLNGYGKKMPSTPDSTLLNGKSNKKERNLTKRKQNTTIESEAKSDNYF